MQYGHTAFDIARAKGHMDVCQELLAHQFLWTILCDGNVCPVMT